MASVTFPSTPPTYPVTVAQKAPEVRACALLSIRVINGHTSPQEFDKMMREQPCYEGNQEKPYQLEFAHKDWSYGYTALHKVTTVRNILLIKHIMAKGGKHLLELADLTTGFTPLQCAVVATSGNKNSSFEPIRTLVELGAKVNCAFLGQFRQQTKIGFKFTHGIHTPLHDAITYHRPLAKFLIAHGAILNTPTSEEYSIYLELKGELEKENGERQKLLPGALRSALGEFLVQDLLLIITKYDTLIIPPPLLPQETPTSSSQS